MKTNKNGFTLIELIVCIGIIAALGITIGLNANGILGKAENNSDKETLNEIAEAALIYSKLSNNRDRCLMGCVVSLEELIKSGLLDKGILNKSNPNEGDKFKNSNSYNIGTDETINYICNNGDAVPINSAGNIRKCS